MKRVVDWFWNYRGNRPSDWNLSHASLSKIMRIAHQGDLIRMAQEGGMAKACVAFWGPSQSGKSSFLSHYLDGDNPEEMALNWSNNEIVRFSSNPMGDTANTVVFNPFNAGMDASGLVTRFYLPDNENDVNRDYPVEILLANRRQVMHSIAVGYRQECRESAHRWTLDELTKRIDTPSINPNRAAFELLFDMCDVCANMARESSVFGEFAKDSRLRNQILNSSYVDNEVRANELVSYILWDNENVLTDLYKKILELKQYFDDRRIEHFYTSMKVASLLENIDAVNPEGAVHLQEAINKVRFSEINNTVFLGEHREGIQDSKFDPGEFGLFQALISEIRIPVKRVERDVALPLINFLSKCDLLDFPGVTNKANGDALGLDNLINLDTNPPPNRNLLLSKVYKIGKTLSTIYAQAEQCAIDSFVIFVDLARAGGISRPSTLISGVRAWQEAYGAIANLPLYVNCSLFGKLVGEVVAAAQGGGILRYCDKVSVLDFAQRNDTEFFFTTNKFKEVPQNLDVEHYFTDDVHFSRMFLHGLGREALNKFFDDKIGADYMLGRISAEVSTRARARIYEDSLRDGQETVLQELQILLPGAEDRDAIARQNAVKKINERLMQALQTNPDETRVKLFKLVKKVFLVPDKELDFVPQTPRYKTDEELANYIRNIARKWSLARKDEYLASSNCQWLVEGDEVIPFLYAISSINVNAFVEMLKNEFYDHNSQVSRSFIAMALNNAFLYGSIERTNISLVEVFINRVTSLNGAEAIGTGIRPMHIDGDEELFEIVKEINNIA